MPTVDGSRLGLGKEGAPSAKHVEIYLLEKGFSEEEARRFLQTMLLRGWHTKTGRPVRNWKQYIFQWQYLLKNPDKKQTKIQSSKKNSHAKRTIQFQDSQAANRSCGLPKRLRPSTN